MHLFFTPDIGSADHYLLNEEESRHCSRVLRLKKGDHIFLTDGKGALFETEVDSESQKRTMVRIINSIPGPDARNYRLHVGIAPTKNLNRLEWFLEKATEIGIDEITPLICEHAERKSVPTDRMYRIMIAAMKQSLKTTLPVLHEPSRFSSFIKEPYDKVKFIAHYDQANQHLKDNDTKGKDVIVLVGPEGDFSQGELHLASEEGFKAVNLGSSRLRTETAGVVVCSLISLLNE
ncbi:MAG TPA: 16S rRNA (uracil(1498)-N(3))-methyltransferase [Bacteroidales bacterium]|nr:16S rRNA (uracil(1498)-N(3))-methyltransferase [Bacteroidales bacterium]